MSITLESMVVRLQPDVPAHDGVPSETQYVYAVRDAVYAFNERCGTRKLHVFPTVAGQAAYTLPADFSRVMQWVPLIAAQGNVLNTSAGLVPLPYFDSLPTETYTVAGQTFTLYPTPTYALQRELWYRAVHVLNEADAYPDMTENVASIIHVKAQANAWRLVCGKVSRGQAWKYQIGDVMIDKTKVGDALKGWVADFDTEFDERVTRLIGQVGGLG